jgi:hypothetical protein
MVQISCSPTSNLILPVCLTSIIIGNKLIKRVFNWLGSLIHHTIGNRDFLWLEATGNKGNPVKIAYFFMVMTYFYGS